VIPADAAPVLELLRRHGVFIEQVAERAVVRAETFQVDSVVRSARQFQGHQEVRLEGRWTTTDSLAVEPNAYVVRGAQSLAVLALYLLEPQSDDGLVTWNVLDPWIRQGARFPIVRVIDRLNVTLRPSR
jgi:hypothetical protein